MANAPAPNWATSLSALVGLAGLILGIIAFIRAGRAASLAERADLRAVSADARAEEAHSILKERHADDRETAKATLEAPEIAETWEGQLQYLRGRPQTDELGSNYFTLGISLGTLAQRVALELLRERRRELYIARITYLNAERTDANIIAFTRTAIKRLGLDKEKD